MKAPFPTPSHQHTIGIRRRELLQVGYSALLGVGLPACLAGKGLAAGASPSSGAGISRPKSIILVFLTGAASHHDTFDMKPEAPPKFAASFSRLPHRRPAFISASTFRNWQPAPTNML